MDHLLERQEDKWLIYPHPTCPPISSSNPEMTTAMKAAATILLQAGNLIEKGTLRAIGRLKGKQ